jgi:hypothetical protein
VVSGYVQLTTADGGVHAQYAPKLSQAAIATGAHKALRPVAGSKVLTARSDHTSAASARPVKAAVAWPRTFGARGPQDQEMA